MNPLLTIITLTIPGRESQLSRLSEEISLQSVNTPTRHHVIRGSGGYGRKMRMSLSNVQSGYVCWVDDDDWIYPTYVEDILNAIHQNQPDVVTFGSVTPGHVPAWLRFGKRDNEGTSPDGGNIRSANHYCAWRFDLAKSMPWLPQNYAAESVWYTGLRLAYPNLREHHIPKVLHEYRYTQSDTKCQNGRSIHLSMANGGNKITILRAFGNQLFVAKGSRQPVHGYYMAMSSSGEFIVIPTTETQILQEIRLR